MVGFRVWVASKWSVLLTEDGICFKILGKMRAYLLWLSLKKVTFVVCGSGLSKRALFSECLSVRISLNGELVCTCVNSRVSRGLSWVEVLVYLSLLHL